MAPRNVQFVQGEYYHIYNRGAVHQEIFRERDNYLFVLQRMKEYSRELRIAVIAYCLMPNHYHLLVRQDADSAEGLLPQRVFNSYVKAYNKRYEVSGTLFEGMYKALHVTTDTYLLHLCRYIHANPVKHGFTTHAADWEYSNYPEWVGARGGTLVDRGFVLEHFAGDAQPYARYLDEYYTGAAPAGFESLTFEE